MPAIFPPGPHGVAQTNAPHLVHAEGHPANQPSGAGAKPADALHAWHDLNMALASALPTALLHAGRFEHAARLNIRGYRPKIR